MSDNDGQQWETYIEYEMPTRVDTATTMRFQHALRTQGHLRDATAHVIDRGTSDSLAATFTLTASDHGSALNAATAAFQTAAAATDVDHGTLRESIARPVSADLDPLD